MAASPPFSSVSAFPLSVSVFFASSASSHSTGLLSIMGREAAAGSGSRVALAAAAWGADSEEGKVYDDAGPLGWFLVLKKVEVDDGGGGGFLGYFLCSGKEKKYRWWLNYSVGVVLQSPPFSPPLLLLFFSSLLSARFFPSVFFSVFSVSSPLFCPFSPPSSRCLSQRSWVLFIEPRAWLFTVLMGSSRLVGHWARLPRFGSHRFSSRCVVGGRPVCSVGGLQAREGPAKSKQKLLFPSSPLHVRGKKKEEQYFGLHPP